MKLHKTASMTSPDQQTDHRDYARIEKALSFLSDQKFSTPSLSEAAQHVGLSEFHFQRLFRRWAGISPKRFCQYLSMQESKKSLLADHSLLETSLDAGLSGTGRLHDCFVSIIAMTPAEYRDGGTGLTIRFGIGETPFGYAVIGSTRRGICLLEFLDRDIVEKDVVGHAFKVVKAAWPSAEVIEDAAGARKILNTIFERSELKQNNGLILHTRGTNFQIRVWEALLQLPAGYSVSYETLAHHLSIDKGARPVASAVARNPVGYVIPCHRVIRKSGIIGEYRWGAIRKHAMIGWENAQIAESPDIAG